MSSPSPSADPGPSDGAEPVPAGPSGDRGLRARLTRRTAVTPAASAYWRGWPEVRADLRSSVALVLAMALAGVPAGVVWWWLAPRADFRITASGPAAVGNPSAELLVADDVVFALVLACTGLLLGASAWFLRRRRGVATVVALSLGACATGLVAWQLGELLGAGPTEAQLTDVGGLVTTSLTLGSPPALAAAPFMALVAYVAAVLYTPGDDLGRTRDVPAAESADQPWAEPAGLPDEGSLVDVPPAGRPAS